MKKTLLSIALVGFAFVASSQTTIFKDNFNSYSIGNLSTGFDPMTEGQGGWFTETLYSGDNAATQIVSVVSNNNALQITGFQGPSTVSPDPSANRTVFRSLQSVWASRPADQNTISMNCKMIVPGLSSSKNTFAVYLLNSNGDRLLGVRFNPNTRIADGYAFVKYPDGSFNTRSLILGYDAATNYNLTFSDAPQTLEVFMAYNKVDGIYSIQVYNSDQTVMGGDDFTSAPTNEALVGVDPSMLMMVAGAGGLTNGSSESVSFDDFQILAQSCIVPNNSDFSYGAISACVGSSNLSPTFLDVVNASSGSFTVVPNTGLSINASGVIDMTLSQPGTYSVKYTSVATNHPTYSFAMCSDFHTEQIVIYATPATPNFTPVSVCSGAMASLPLISTNSVKGTWSPAVAPITSATQYTFTSATNQCVSQTPVVLNVTVNSLPTASISSVGTSFCQGSSVLLTSSQGASYEWMKDATVLGSASTQSATEAGSYTVKVTDGNGCSAVSSPTVLTTNAPVTPTFTIKDLVCKGSAAITLPASSSNTPSITGTWSTGSPSATVTTVATSTVGAAVYTFTPAPSICATNYTKTVTVSTCAGIEEAIISPFTIYPNPSNDVISVSFSELTSRTGTIKFISADGKLIESRDYTNSSVETFDVKSLNPGIYFLQIDNSIEKVVVQ